MCSRKVRVGASVGGSYDATRLVVRVVAEGYARRRAWALLHKDLARIWDTYSRSRFPCKPPLFAVEPMGSESLTSTVQRRSDALLGISGACKSPANSDFLSRILCSGFREIYSGCCTG